MSAADPLTWRGPDCARLPGAYRRIGGAWRSLCRCRCWRTLRGAFGFG
jgi:hypothetical protein